MHHSECQSNISYLWHYKNFSTLFCALYNSRAMIGALCLSLCVRILLHLTKLFYHQPVQTSMLNIALLFTSQIFHIVKVVGTFSTATLDCGGGGVGQRHGNVFSGTLVALGWHTVPSLPHDVGTRATEGILVSRQQPHFKDPTFH